MGLFKRFFSRSTPTEDEEDYSIEQMEIDMKKFGVHNQHYVFVHRMLRDVFFDMPDKIMAILKDERRNNSLLKLWNNVADVVEGLSLVEPDGLCCEIKTYDGITIALITLPTPKNLNEAYFVALVYRPAQPGQEAITRFVTLEQGIDIVFLCEWGGLGMHKNMGPRCGPEVDDFFEVVCGML